MDETDLSPSEKAKKYLTQKLDELQIKILKLKRKRKKIKILYYSSITLSIGLAGILTTLSSFAGLPLYIIPILSTSSGILTGISAKFNLEKKKAEITKTIDKIKQIKGKLDFVLSCNGLFSEVDFKQLISEISIL